MNVLDKWAERIYSESDFGRSVATSVGGVVGLLAYLWTADWVVGAFTLIIVFPVVRYLAASRYQRAKQVNDRLERDVEADEMYRRLSSEEKAVVESFITSGGSVMTWGQINRSDVSRSAIESLIQRELLFTSVSADGMTETFVVNTHLFDAGLRKQLPKECSVSQVDA